MFTEKQTEYINNVKSNLAKDGHTLLYLCKFGSHLYGTSTPASDLDIKGIFLPSLESCLMNDAPKHYTFSSGDKGSKNTKDDVDIQLWSFQYWMQMVKKGETGAIDLLYSQSNHDCIVYINTLMSDVFMNASSLFTAHDCNAYVGYAIGQAKKYGVKGSRLGVIKRVNEISSAISYSFIDTLGDHIDWILKWCYDESYCFVKEIKGIKFLVLCGAKHPLYIKFSEFNNRVSDAYKTYGDRAREAEKNEGLDFKALSHAVRSIYQMKQLLTVGKIQYPLDSADELLKIKRGEYTWNEIEKMIMEGLDEIDSLRDTKSGPTYNPVVAKALTLSMYEE